MLRGHSTEVRLMRGRGIGDKAERQAGACRPGRVFGFHSRVQWETPGRFLIGAQQDLITYE